MSLRFPENVSAFDIWGAGSRTGLEAARRSRPGSPPDAVAASPDGNTSTASTA